MKKNRQMAFGFVAGLLVMTLLALAIVFSNTGVVTVNETLSVVAGNLDVQIGPNQTVTKDVTILNDGPVDVDAQVLADVTSDIGGAYPGVSVVSSPVLTVPAGGGVDVSLDIVASNGVSAGSGTLAVEVIRP